MRPQAAGILFECCGEIFLIQRSDEIPDPNIWSVPGGMCEPGESPIEAAMREVKEEIGFMPECEFDSRFYTQPGGPIEYSTFLAHVPEKFQGRLNYESKAQGWFGMLALPSLTHPGTVETLKQLGFLS